ncbi:hypothetical protein [Candidatus Methylobacter favarea]|uniref:hypothetical protein n=1 Tax=Candidatus Methylobacter favarea TaxID=2707345 RepID=UPI001C2D8317|nr:hypothetical protein [Candidatus Methylobacter favarea]
MQNGLVFWISLNLLQPMQQLLQNGALFIALQSDIFFQGTTLPVQSAAFKQSRRGIEAGS